MVIMSDLTKKPASSKFKMPKTRMEMKIVITGIMKMEDEGKTHQVQISAIAKAHDTSPMKKEGGEKITVILDGPHSPLKY
jgi:hypothetical protein